MISLIIGGSKSGKSKYAEDLVCMIAAKNNYIKYYVATMIPYDDEDRNRIKKHQEQRKNKDFKTIEEGLNIDNIILDNANNLVLLVDSITAYVLNVVFKYDKDPNIDVNFNLDILKRQFDTFLTNNKNVVIVADYIFSNVESLTNSFSLFTNNYLELLGLFMQYLALKSDNVIEVKAGIAGVIKGELYE